MILDINIDAAKEFTRKLEKLHRSALPSAVRGALNKAAYDVKTNTMPKSANDTFEKRQPNFFKANSRFENATGFNISAMKSAAGFIEGKLKGDSNYAVKDLEQQEHGGAIGGKGFIAMKTARVSKSTNKNVRANFRLGQMRNVINAQKGTGSKKQRFVRAAFMAKKLYGDNAFVLGNVWKGSRTLSKIDEISSSIENRKIQFKRTPLYTFRQGRKITVAGTNFMKRASLESGANIEHYYVLEAIRQIKKLQG